MYLRYKTNDSKKVHYHSDKNVGRLDKNTVPVENISVFPSYGTLGMYKTQPVPFRTEVPSGVDKARQTFGVGEHVGNLPPFTSYFGFSKFHNGYGRGNAQAGPWNNYVPGEEPPIPLNVAPAYAYSPTQTGGLDDRFPRLKIIGETPY